MGDEEKGKSIFLSEYTIQPFGVGSGLRDEEKQLEAFEAWANGDPVYIKHLRDWEEEFPKEAKEFRAIHVSRKQTWECASAFLGTIGCFTICWFNILMLYNS